MTRRIQKRAQFMNEVAHELKGLLVPVIGSLELLLDDKRLTKGQRENVRDSLDYAWQVNGLLDNMRDMTLLLAGSFKLDAEPTDMVAFLTEISSELGATVRKKGLSFRTSIPPSLPQATVDRKKMRQALSLMVSHALSSTEKGGLALEASLAGRGLRMRLAYTGSSKVDKERPFVSIFHVDNSEEWTRHGTGVELALCKGIIELHKGRMWLEQPTAGETALVFSLPFVSRFYTHLRHEQ